MGADTPSPFDSALGKINSVVSSATNAALQISRAVAGNPAVITAVQPETTTRNQTIAVVIILAVLVGIGVLLWGSRR